jgi:hypothetical protein
MSLSLATLYTQAQLALAELLDRSEAFTKATATAEF